MKRDWKLALNESQKEILTIAAQKGIPLVSEDEQIKSTFKQLSNLGLVRPQTMLDGKSKVGHAKIIVSYQITADGRTAFAQLSEPATGDEGAEPPAKRIGKPIRG